MINDRFTGNHRRNIACVREETIAEVHAVCALRWEAFLVALPSTVVFGKLIRNRLADCVRRRFNRSHAVYVNQAGWAWIGCVRARALIREIDSWSLSIGSSSRDWAKHSGWTESPC